MYEIAHSRKEEGRFYSRTVPFTRQMASRRTYLLNIGLLKGKMRYFRVTLCVGASEADAQSSQTIKVALSKLETPQNEQILFSRSFQSRRLLTTTWELNMVCRPCSTYHVTQPFCPGSGWRISIVNLWSETNLKVGFSPPLYRYFC